MLASLGAMKSVANVKCKTIMALTSDYDTEEITILYREGVTRADIEITVR